MSKLQGPIGPIPTHESQVRPLSGLEPEQQREIWKVATKNNPSPTAKHVVKTIELVSHTNDLYEEPDPPKSHPSDKPIWEPKGRRSAPRADLAAEVRQGKKEIIEARAESAKIVWERESLYEAVREASGERGGALVEIDGITFAVALGEEAIEDLRALNWPTAELPEAEAT